MSLLRNRVWYPILLLVFNFLLDSFVNCIPVSARINKLQDKHAENVNYVKYSTGDLKEQTPDKYN